MTNSTDKTALVSSMVIALVFTIGTTPAKAASTNQVTVNKTTIDYVLNKITIIGANFGPSTPSVTLQNTPLSVQTYNSGTGTIVASLPGPLNPGTYLLAVTTTTGTPATGTFDVAYGSNGPTGPTGRAPTACRSSWSRPAKSSWSSAAASAWPATIPTQANSIGSLTGRPSSSSPAW